MTRNVCLSESTKKLLTYLRGLNSHGHGYEVRGIRGWATAGDVERATNVYGTAEQLRQLAASGRLAREDVRVPDATSAVWVYRIANKGGELLAHVEGREYVPIVEPGPAVPNQAWVSDTVAAALDALRYAAKHPGKRVWIPGEPEWRTSRELTDWLKADGDRTGKPRIFLGGDLALIVRTRLGERRDEPAVIYRITVSGTTLQPLVWHGTEPQEA